MEYVYIIIGFVLLIKGADILIEGSSSIAAKFGLSSLMIGLTIVTFGTSAPEFFVNIIGVSNGQTDLALGNILGSIIANTLLVLGIAAMIHPLHASKSTIYKEVPYLFLGALALIIVSADVYLGSGNINVITRNEGLILLLFFVIFVSYTFGIAKNNVEKEDESLKNMNSIKATFLILLGISGLVGGAALLVNGAESLARGWGVSEGIIGLTVVAVGTSLPELATSAIAAYKKNSDIAIGNVVGSNIYGIFLIIGSSGATANLVVGKYAFYDILIAFGVTLLLGVFLLFWGKKGKITRVEGGFLVLSYFAYIAYLFITQIFV